MDEEEKNEKKDGESLVREYILEAIEVISRAKTMPLSSSVLIPRDELIEILQDALNSLPDELKNARWLLNERDEVLQRANKEADSIIEEARVQAERMIQRSEVVRQAKKYAEEITQDAQDKSKAMKREAEDYCDRKLAAFEIALNDLLKVVASARDKLAPKVSDIPEGAISGQVEPPLKAAKAFFDQDMTDEEGN
jgi:ElaB/YqjD/DUF883 family membrane-anchored ribosome-binding protein